MGVNPIYATEATNLGHYLAKHSIGLVYGGGKIGIMGTIADAVLEKKGEVIGVIPNLLKNDEVAHTKITKMVTPINI